MTDPKVYQDIEDLKKWRESLASVEVARPLYAIYNSNAGQSFAHNSFDIVNFEDVVSDPDSLVTTGASWAFTCPIDGIYLVTASILFASSTAWALGEAGLLSVYKSGSPYANLDRKDNFTSSVTAQFMQLSGSTVVIASAGDTINVRARQQSNSTIALTADNNYNYVNIFRMN